MDCTSGITVTRQDVVFENIETPVLALINSYQHSINLIYNNHFDDYLNFPIVEKQFNFRLANLIHTRKLISKNESPQNDQVNALTLDQSSRHIKLAKLCKNYLQNHLGEDHTLADLAKVLGTNRNSLAIAFKTVYHCGVFAWLRQERLRVAHKYLSASDVTIQSIAYELGFSDPANFSRLYKQQYGISPKYTREMSINKLTKTENN